MQQFCLLLVEATQGSPRICTAIRKNNCKKQKILNILKWRHTIIKVIREVIIFILFYLIYNTLFVSKKNPVDYHITIDKNGHISLKPC